MPADLTTVTAITKEVYGPRIVNQMESEIVLTKRMEKSSRGVTTEVGGKYVTFPLKVRRNSGIGYRNEGEQLQAAGQQGWVSVKVPLRYGYGRVRLSGQVIELVNENYQSFASTITEEMTGLKDDLKKDTNRILWGNGLGVLATVDTAVTSNTISVGTSADAVKWLDMDMMVDICSSVGVVKAANRKITGINEAAGDFTFDGAAQAVVVGDIVVRTGNYNKEPNGLTSLVTDSTAALFTLSSTTEPLWSSPVDSSGGSLAESKMIAMVDRLVAKGGQPSAIFTDLGSRRAYFNLLTTQRRYTGTKDFGGGFTGLTFSYDKDIPVVVDIDAPAGKMWFLDEERFKIYQSKDWSWEDRDNAIWKWVPDYDAVQALMKKYWEFAIERRNTSGVMTGITPG